MSNRTQFLQRRAFGFAVLLCPLLCLPACQTRAQEEPAAVTVCAYNLKNWLARRPYAAAANPDLPDIPKPESEKGRIVKFLTSIQPDVLGVCEIGAPEDLADLQTRLKAAGLDLPNLEFNRGDDPARSLGFLTRFPISQRHSQTQLEYQLGEQTLFMQRGILDVVLDITPQFQVRFLGVHLKSKRPIPEADESLMRRNEAHLLRRYIEGILTAAPDTRLLCYGDFNEHRNEPAIAEIIGSRASPAHLGEVPLRDANGLVWTQFWDAADVYSRFDYFFTSRPLRPHVDLKKSFIFTDADFLKASDHRPIVLSLRPQPLRSRSRDKGTP